MNRARAFINDAFSSGAGRILTDTASLSIEYLNSAVEELQDKIRDYGSITMIVDNVIILGLPVVASIDPSLQVSLSYTGYNNGTMNYGAPYVLPADLLTPRFLWERMNGSSLPFTPMRQPQAGLESVYQGESLCSWEWRGDAIWMPGATTPRDIRLRYDTYFTPIPAGTNLSTVQIGVMASTNALAKIVAYNYALARGSQAAATMQADAEKHMRYIENRYVRQKQGVIYQREPYGDDSDYGWSISGIM